MLTADKKAELTDLMQKNFTDLDIARDEPFKFRSGKWLLIVDSVRLLEHDRFLLGMFEIVQKHFQILANVDFLTAYNLSDQNVIRKLIDQVQIFKAAVGYSQFLRQSVKFVCRWASVAKVKGEGAEMRVVAGPKRNARWARAAIESMAPDEFIYVLFLMFVRNYDIVKKNTLSFLQMFVPELNTNTQTETSSSASKKEVAPMPKFSPIPYPESTLKIFEQQSKMH
jgi:hypothetical protein